ncbi:uncharacterized protein [Physcomitrium patens]|uniref:Telomerase Cajal body protein 1 n=1 Tax=Physcomitrium patens TaxID=3218 RepID=A0A7I4FS37_PHYPA|nr:telomerase Cajal body protein 1-like isoform X2 [Physcomitrium patens]|eukprot:XP_024377425.1 telomerase Cajal body protein 1-like isoform X2 [Physcomitrella patens]
MGMADDDGQEHTEPEQSAYYWPVLDFQTPPARRYHFYKQMWSPSAHNNFFKGAKWSPDGSCFITSSEDNSLRIFDLPSDVLESAVLYDNVKSDEDSNGAALIVDEGEAVYDFCWYPCMTTTDSSTCIFATSTRDHPVHLWDAVSGQLRCTYRAYDAMDEITAAYSIAFNNSGTKLFCGYNKTLRIFDTSRPGREFSQYSTLTKTKDGQTGIISCLAFNPSSEDLFAAGSYNKTTALYSEHNAELLFVLHGQEGGVTQVLFSKDGNYLYTGGRKDPNILCWDVRNTAAIVYKLPRVTSDTNQRIAFDIEPCGRHLGTGGQDGYVHIYDLQTGDWANSFQAAADTVNAFSFHPTLPVGVTSSGHRRFSTDYDDEGISKETSCIAQENCASVWLFPCTWQSSIDPSSTVETTELENLQGESLGTWEENV